MRFHAPKESDALRLNIGLRRGASEVDDFIGRCVSETLMVSDVDDGESSSMAMVVPVGSLLINKQNKIIDLFRYLLCWHFDK